MHIDGMRMCVERFPKLFRNVLFSQFSDDDRTRVVLEKMLKAHLEEPCSDSLLLMGRPCTGKTFRMAALCRALVLGNKDVLWVPAYDYQEDCVNGELCPDCEQSWLYYGRHNNYLAIDGLGRERCAKWEANFVTQTIKWRIENGKPTFVTTSLSPDDLKAVYGEDFLSDLSNQMLVVALDKIQSPGLSLADKYGV